MNRDIDEASKDEFEVVDCNASSSRCQNVD